MYLGVSEPTNRLSAQSTAYALRNCQGKHTFGKENEEKKENKTKQNKTKNENEKKSKSVKSLYL